MFFLNPKIGTHIQFLHLLLLLLIFNREHFQFAMKRLIFGLFIFEGKRLAYVELSKSTSKFAICHFSICNSLSGTRLLALVLSSVSIAQLTKDWKDVKFTEKVKM
jgi:hypothetical protein